MKKKNSFIRIVVFFVLFCITLWFCMNYFSKYISKSLLLLSFLIIYIFFFKLLICLSLFLQFFDYILDKINLTLKNSEIFNTCVSVYPR